MLVWIQNPFDNLPAEGYRKQRFWLMAEAFVRAGHRVVFWTSDFSHAKKRRRSMEGMAAPAGMEVRLVPTRPYRRNVSWARVLSHRAYARQWRQLAAAERERPQLIVASTPTLSGAAAAIEMARGFGARCVIDVMDAWPETFERLVPRGFRWLAKPLLIGLRRTARRLYREADLVTGVCERYRALTGRADYCLAYHGIELPEPGASCAEPCVASGRVRLVYAGNLGKTYDLETVVRAVEANPDFELDVAGFGDFHSASPRIRFHGLLPADGLRALLRRSDVGIVPMRAESWVGVPYKFCDYSQEGLAIVSSLGGEASALLDKYRCGTTYRAGDVASLGAAIRRAQTLERGASRRMCAAEFDARAIYDAYVGRAQELVGRLRSAGETSAA